AGIIDVGDPGCVLVEDAADVGGNILAPGRFLHLSRLLADDAEIDPGGQPDLRQRQPADRRQPVACVNRVQPHRQNEEGEDRNQPARTGDGGKRGGHLDLLLVIDRLGFVEAVRRAHELSPPVKRWASDYWPPFGGGATLSLLGAARRSQSWMRARRRKASAQARNQMRAAGSALAEARRASSSALRAGALSMSIDLPCSTPLRSGSAHSPSSSGSANVDAAGRF